MIQCYIDSSVNKLFANITKFPKQLLFACHCLVTTVKYWWHDNLDNCYQIIHNSAFQAVCSQSGRNYSMESALWYGYRPHNFLICSTHSQWMNNGWEADKLFISLFLLCMQHFMIMCSKMNYIPLIIWGLFIAVFFELLFWDLNTWGENYRKTLTE